MEVDREMKDKERILMTIVTRVIPGIAYGLRSEKDSYIEPCMMRPEKLKHGDLVFANTSIYPNDFVVGFVNEVKDDCVVIREIGSERLCNYYNESFNKINKKYLGYEILEGIQYKIYQKVLKAFEEVVTNELANNQKVQLVGFGTFDVAERAAREGRNPQTGESMPIPASKSPRFKAGKALKDAVNK